MSRTTIAKSDRTRKRIVDVAAAAFREHGVDRVGVRDVMKLAGLTRGGFYFHFADKDALLAEASREAARGNAASHLKWVEGAAEGKSIQAFIEHYLSEEHRDSPQLGCLLAAMGGEMSRANANQRKAFAEGIDAVIDGIAALLPGANDAERKNHAELLIASLAGVLMMARLQPNRARSNRLLANARKFYALTFTRI